MVFGRDANFVNEQFRENPDERNERLRESRHRRTLDVLWKLIADLSDSLTDEGTDYSPEGLDAIRRRVANALPPSTCPDWLRPYRDPAVIQSR
jgi:hypothetical protein